MITVKLNNNYLELRITGLKHDEFVEVLDTIKSIPGRRYQDGYWLIPVSETETLKGLLGSQLDWKNESEEPSVDLKDITNQIDISRFKLPPYPFQILGMSYLVHIGRGILADEMGLGKSNMAIGAVDHLYAKGEISKVLVICPASLKYEWAKEIQKFTDHSVTVIDGPKRHSQYQEDSLFTIINYELARLDSDIEIIKSLNFDVIILDEGHRIKNWESLTSKKIIDLNAKYKWILTGTPMQNRPEELFNLFRFINPDILGNWWSFRHRYLVLGSKFGRPNMVIGYKNLPELRQRISPYMLRRLKSEVAPDLPKIIVNTYAVTMTTEQDAIHEEIRMAMRKILDELKNWKEEGPHPKEDQLLGMLTMLIETSDSPQLLNMSSSGLAQRFAKKTKQSPKLEELCSIIESLSPNTKVVIFTQFERMQRLIVERLNKYGNCAILNGTMKPYERQAAIDKFRFNENYRFFVSTDAGSTGVNLQVASVVVNFDLPWNPATYAQRNARIHRIDSKHEVVNVINLISKDSIDERILKVLYDKIDLSNQLVEKTQEEKKVVSRLTGNLVDRLTREAKGKRNRRKN
jgi:SNF2 family DNA or RNA helicase